jgi:L-iditol 2-dehydrogenase
MKALRFYAPGDVRVEDVPEPECGPKEVKIKVKNCSTCGTDVKILNNGHVNITRVTTMGHEVAGEVVKVGAEAKGDFTVGDRVQCIAAVPCGDCHECRKGWMEVCQNQTSRLPVRRRLRRVHDRARAGPQGRRPQPHPGQRGL